MDPLPFPILEASVSSPLEPTNVGLWAASENPNQRCGWSERPWKPFPPFTVNHK